jgi:hypothetical protein
VEIPASKRAPGLELSPARLRPGLVLTPAPYRVFDVPSVTAPTVVAAASAAAAIQAADRFVLRISSLLRSDIGEP